MSTDNEAMIRHILDWVSGIGYIKPEDIPNIDLYMDQVTTFMEGQLAHSKRYQDDKSILKQYVENDQVIENGKVIRTVSEIVPPASDSHQPIVRPLIRLQEKNIILTRINPQV